MSAPTARELLVRSGDASVSWAHMTVEEHLDAAQRAVAQLGETWTSGYFTITPLQIDLAKIHIAAAQVQALRETMEVRVR